MAVLLAFLLAPPPAAAGWSESLGRYPDAWNLNAHVGIKTLDSGDWAPADKATSLGVDWDYAGREWPAGLTGALYYARASGSEGGIDADSTTMELHAGARNIWYSRNNGTEWFRPSRENGGGIAEETLFRNERIGRKFG